MTDSDHLLQEFIAEDRRTGGDADPAAYLDRVQGVERDELEALIDAYLARAPRREFDAAAFDDSPARVTAEALWRTMAGASGRWPAVLPSLRHRAQITRSQLVRRLADSLGVADREDKVAAYYHAMEHGQLPAEGVQDRVLEALGRIVGESANRLRELGRGPAEASAGIQAAPIFARTATPDLDLLEADSMSAGSPPPAERSARDDVDELFTGASGS